MDSETKTVGMLNEARRPAPTMPVGGADEASGVSPLTIRLLSAAKDGLDVVLDLLLIGEIPVVGQLPGAMGSLLILYLKKGGAAGIGRRMTLPIVIAILDNLPLVNDLPLTFIGSLLR